MDPVSAALQSWTLPVWPSATLAVTAAVYFRGWRALRMQVPHRFGTARLVAFLAGLLAVLIAVASPLDAFAGFLLQIHMAQHLLLMMVAPPLVWLGAPAAPLLRGLPRTIGTAALGPFLAWPRLQAAARWLVHPAVSWTLFVVTVLAWHLPGPYQLALRAPGWHEVEHGAFLFAGLLFWFPVVQPWPSQPIWPRWTMLPYLLLADVQNTVLSAFFAFSERIIYPSYAAGPRLWGITALDDQVTAGALMWVPGSLAFLLPVGLIVTELLASRAVQPIAAAHRGVAARRPATARRAFDLLTIPVVGWLLRRGYARRGLQLAMLGLAGGIIADGLLGPQMAPMNLAGVLPWTYWRGLLVVTLLIAGNFFCMACPFMLPRELAKRLLPARRAWPRHLRSKWLAVALLALWLWAYEALAPWDSPAWTAAIVLGYFGAAAAVDGLFRGASFCKYVCPIGQFNFIQSMVSPLTVRVRQPETCRACSTHDCIRGNRYQRGCELDLFQPEKRGNLDCTFCLDCVAACPHDNVGILAAAPLRELTRDPYRSSLRHLSERPDVAALALICVFGAFANAAGMTAPVLAWQAAAQARFSLSSTLPVITVGLVISLLLVPAVASLAAAAVGQHLAATFRRDEPHRPMSADRRAIAAIEGRREGLLALACRFSFALVPLGLSMWTAHFIFHLLTGASALPPIVRRVAAELGSTLIAAPAWAAPRAGTVPEWITGLQLLLLDGGLLLSLYAAWRISLHLRGRTAAAVALLAPWALLGAALWAAGVWIVFQPMEMRGMVH